MTVSTDQPVRKDVTVQASPEKAFDVFTAGMHRWWDPAYKIGGEAFQTVVLEPYEGGRWYERGEHGGECDWGRVLVWDPPGRVVLAWQITADWQYDPDLTTEVEVRFLANSDRTTRVELEHRGLEALGPAGVAMRAVFDSPGGWAGLLQRFTGVVTKT